MTRFSFGRLAKQNHAATPLNPECPTSRYIMASKRSDDQRAEELRAAAKRGIAGPGRMMGKVTPR